MSRSLDAGPSGIVLGSSVDNTSILEWPYDGPVKGFLLSGEQRMVDCHWLRVDIEILREQERIEAVDIHCSIDGETVTPRAYAEALDAPARREFIGRWCANSRDNVRRIIQIEQSARTPDEPQPQCVRCRRSYLASQYQHGRLCPSCESDADRLWRRRAFL